MSFVPTSRNEIVPGLHGLGAGVLHGQPQRQCRCRPRDALDHAVAPIGDSASGHRHAGAAWANDPDVIDSVAKAGSAAQAYGYLDPIAEAWADGRLAQRDYRHGAGLLVLSVAPVQGQCSDAGRCTHPSSQSAGQRRPFRSRHLALQGNGELALCRVHQFAAIASSRSLHSHSADRHTMQGSPALADAHRAFSSRLVRVGLSFIRTMQPSRRAVTS
jgi:hypothetical protein